MEDFGGFPLYLCCFACLATQSLAFATPSQDGKCSEATKKRVGILKRQYKGMMGPNGQGYVATLPAAKKRLLNRRETDSLNIQHCSLLVSRLHERMS